jgi:PAS domain S-box-containing protein
MVKKTQKKQPRQKKGFDGQKFRKLFELLPFAAYFCDLQGKILECNRQFTRLHGTKKGSTKQVGKNIADFVSKEEKTKLRRIFTLTKTGKGPEVEQLMLKREDGLVFLAEINAVLVKDSKGKPVGLLGTAQDITRRKKNEEALNSFMLGIENSNDVIVMTDINGNITYANKALEKVYNWRRKEILGKKPSMWKTDRYDEKVYKKFWNTLLAGKSTKIEFTNRTKSGKHVIMQTAVNPIKDRNSKITGFLSIQSDVTKRKKAEEELKKKVQQMEFIGRVNLKRHKEMMKIKKEIKKLKERLSQKNK